MKWGAFLFCVLNAAACATTRTDERTGLRVLTYNIHAGKDAAQQPNLTQVAEVIRSTGADIVLLQEVDRRTTRSGGEDHVAMLASLTGFHVAFGKSLDYQGGEYGIALLSRYPLDSVRVIPLQVKPLQERSGGAYEPRVGLHAIVRAPRGPVHVINTHLDPAAEPTYRHQEIIGLLAHVSRNVPRNAVIIFGGDLNARPDTPEISALGLALSDAWSQCGVAGRGETFPSNQPDRRIDYIWLRAASCTRASVVETNASDHRPLLVQLSR
jgi:endonuclease/exonuclease/phosphatase family metal-dependent hydrolase